MTRTESKLKPTIFFKIIFLFKKSLLDQKSTDPKSTQHETELEPNHVDMK